MGFSTPAREADRHAWYRDLVIGYEGSSVETPIRVPDLSARGMFINTPDEFPEGAVLKVRFWLARTNFQVLARAEVRYCLPGVGIGVEFIRLPEAAERAIAEEVAYQRGVAEAARE